MSPQPHSHRTTDHRVGALAMLGGIACLTGMDAFAKVLIEDDIHPLQLLAIRGLFIAAMMLLTFAARSKLSLLKPSRPVIQGVRGVFGIFAPLSFFMSLEFLPLTDATVIFFTSVFSITLISAIFLKEKIGVYRWSAVVIGYFGVVIALSPELFPDVSGDNLESQLTKPLLGYLLVLASSLCYACLFTSGRWLSKTESVSSLVLSYNAGVGVAALVVLPLVWVPMQLDQVAGVIFLSLLAVAGHYGVTTAFSKAEASLVAPLEYTGLIWVVALDFLFWNVMPGLHMMAGATLIIASGMFVLHRESLRNQNHTH